QGERLKAALWDLVAEFEVAGDVRGRGLLLGLEFVTDDASRAPAPDVARDMATACRQRGLLVQTVSDNVWRIAPPITVSDDEIDRAVSIIRSSLQEREQ
ncbi:MAG: aminotransferase class III-fold pyridoxal phosphate-dependent enzyme, partial [Actinomycetia bacterium]|nr:aminotransferase class III-fold pyridoxal phosphate-dependent enzyme [Actinomycetes bacterium]